MPIQAPTTITGPAASEFKDTTAAFRKTGPVEKYQPVSDALCNQIVNGLGPMVPRVDEATKEGKMVSLSTVRAAEIAAKIQKGDKDLSPREIAQALITTTEALDVGLEDPNSPYYQGDEGLRDQRRSELISLSNELNGYLTGEARKPTQRVSWLRRRTITVAPRPDRPLTAAEIIKAKEQSRVIESYDKALERIAKERFGKTTGLTREEQRFADYSASEEVSRQFADERVQKILDEVHGGEATPNLILECKTSGTENEKRFARRVEKIEDERADMLRRTKQLNQVLTMSEFQRFLVVDEETLSQAEIAEAMIQELGLIDVVEINLLKNNPDEAFNRFFQRASSLGTIAFTGKLFRGKLQRMRDERLARAARTTTESGPQTPPPAGTTGEQPPAVAGAAPAQETAGASSGGENLVMATVEDQTREALTDLPEAELSHLALLLADGKLPGDPLQYLTNLGVPQDKAEAMLKAVVEDRQFVIQNPDGTYRINGTKLGEWDDLGLAALAMRGGIDLNNTSQVENLRKQIEAALSRYEAYSDPTKRSQKAEERIKNVRELAKVNDKNLSLRERQEIGKKKWGKRGLGLLMLLLSPFLIADINKLLQEK